jgi:transcriptional regulator with XRE-family HTH domain
MNTIVVIPDPRTLLGNRVRELRLGKELSQEKLAELHRNFVGAIEWDQKNIGLVSLMTLAHTLSVKLSVLLDTTP